VALINSQTRLHQLVETLQAHNDDFGYQRLETPILQPADLFLTKAGDQLIQRLFTFERFGRQWALRPEFTASAAAAYAEMDTHSDTPTRWQFAGAVFADAPESSQVQQRYSVGTELIGWSSPRADAETIALAFGGVRAVGVPDARIILGSVQFLRALFEGYDLDSRLLRFLMEHIAHLHTDGKAFILDRFDRMTTLGAARPDSDGLELTVLLQNNTPLVGRSREDILNRLQRKTQRSAVRGVVVTALDQLEALHHIAETPASAFVRVRALLDARQTQAQVALDALETLVDLLEAAGVPADRIIVQPTLARDWNYYTGAVFEVRASDNTLLAGGGRYDELVRLMGGSDTPSVGLAFYVDDLSTIVQHGANGNA